MLRRSSGGPVAPQTIEEQLTGLMPPSGTAMAWAFFAQRVRAAELAHNGGASAPSSGASPSAAAPAAADGSSSEAHRSRAEALASLPSPSSSDLARISSCLSSLRALLNQVRHVPLHFPGGGGGGAGGAAGGRWSGAAPPPPAAGAYKQAAQSSEFLTVDPDLCDCLWRALRDARFCALLCALFVRASLVRAFPGAFPGDAEAAEADTPSSPLLCLVPPTVFEWAGDIHLLHVAAAAALHSGAATSQAVSRRNAFLAALGSSEAPLAIEAANRMRALRSLHGEAAALLMDVLGNASLRSVLLRHRAAIVSQWRRSFDAVSETLLPLAYELQQTAAHASAGAGRGDAAPPPLKQGGGAGALSSGDSAELVQVRGAGLLSPRRRCSDAPATLLPPFLAAVAGGQGDGTGGVVRCPGCSSHGRRRRRPGPRRPAGLRRPRRRAAGARDELGHPRNSGAVEGRGL